MVDWFSSIFSFLFLQAKLLMPYLRLIPTLLFVFALTGCGSDEIEVSEEQSAAQKKVEELGGNWTGRGAISIDFSATRMAVESKTISDADLSVLAEVENLEMLDLSGSPISDAGIKHLAGLTKVNTLNITGTQITGEGIQAIMDLPLFQIAYKNCPDDVAVAIADISSVKILQLDGSQLTNLGIAALAELPELRQLMISGSQISDEGLATLGNLKNLNALDISNTAVTDKGITVLGGLSNLNSVSLSGTQVTQAGVDKLQQLLPDTYIDFESQEFGSGQGRPGGLGGQPQRSRETADGDARKSPFDAITSLFSGGSDEDATLEEEVPEESVEEEEKGGGTLGAIFRSLNPID